jgi:glucoamylase
MAAAGPPQVSIGRTTTNVSGYLATEEPYARARLLCNLGKDGCAASGASEGVLVASPSKSDPDCELRCGLGYRKGFR